MTITYQLEPKDLNAFVRYGQTKLRFGRRSRKFILGFSVCLALLMMVTTSHEPVGFRIAFFCVTAAVLCGTSIGLELVLNRLMLWRFFTPKTHKINLCEQTITLTEEAVVNLTPYSETRAFWHGIYRVADTKAYVYIFTSETAAHVIPKRAFHEPESALLFYERALSLHAAAQKPA